MNRNTDRSDRFYPRVGSRLFQDSFGWWVRLREGDQGPFYTVGLAEVYLKEFLELAAAVPAMVPAPA